MRKKNSIINMIVGLVGQLLNMLLSFGGRMVFVHYLSQEYLGVNGLFGDVLGMLNLAELGIGSAMLPPAIRDLIPAVLQELHLSGVPEGIYPQGDFQERRRAEPA